MLRTNTIRTFVIEPQTIFVPTISGVLLDAHLEIAGVLETVDHRVLLEGRPDVIFADLDLLEGDPASIVGLLRRLLPDALILVYTGSCDDVGSKRAALGANGIFSKAMTREELTDGIKMVVSASGQGAMSASPTPLDALPGDSPYRGRNERR